MIESWMGFIPLRSISVIQECRRIRMRLEQELSDPLPPVSFSPRRLGVERVRWE
jgi:hypothetical protein